MWFWLRQRVQDLEVAVRLLEKAQKGDNASYSYLEIERARENVIIAAKAFFPMQRHEHEAHERFLAVNKEAIDKVNAKPVIKDEKIVESLKLNKDVILKARQKRDVFQERMDAYPLSSTSTDYPNERVITSSK